MATGHTAAQPAIPGNGENPFRVRWDGTINLGTLLHLLVLTATLAAAYFGVQGRLTQMEAQQQAILERIVSVEGKADNAARRNQRIELYLQGRDRRYWDAVRDYESAMPPATHSTEKPPEKWRRP